MSSDCSIALLSGEVVYIILGYLEQDELAMCCSVSKEFYDIANIDLLWSRFANVQRAHRAGGDAVVISAQEGIPALEKCMSQFFQSIVANKQDGRFCLRVLGGQEEFQSCNREKSGPAIYCTCIYFGDMPGRVARGAPDGTVKLSGKAVQRLAMN